jgi:hypothetical protein
LEEDAIAAGLVDPPKKNPNGITVRDKSLWRAGEKLSMKREKGKGQSHDGWFWSLPKA